VVKINGLNGFNVTKFTRHTEFGRSETHLVLSVGSGCNTTFDSYPGQLLKNVKVKKGPSKFSICNTF
jgi:hypothetical protein